MLKIVDILTLFCRVKSHYIKFGEKQERFLNYV